MQTPKTVHTDKPKKKLTKAKKILLVPAALLLILIVWIAASVVYEIAVNGEYYAYRYSAERISDEPLNITFAPVDFDENIYENKGYLEKNRDIRYIVGAQSTEVSLDENASFYGEGLVFFQNYFNCVIGGEYESYRDLFWDEYFEDENNLSYPDEPFTMQKLYDISVDWRNTETVIVSQTEEKQYYIVRYAIYQNNGTFRADIRPDTVVPLLFELTKKGDELRISKIIKYIG
ncbi:MAG: hypothetical protein ACI3XM_09800 [Eubacteriales bacterium]